MKIWVSFEDIVIKYDFFYIIFLEFRTCKDKCGVLLMAETFFFRNDGDYASIVIKVTIK